MAPATTPITTPSFGVTVCEQPEYGSHLRDLMPRF
jgi:hypothetical protein